MANEIIKKDLEAFIDNAQNFLLTQPIENFLCEELENLDEIKNEVNAIIKYFQSLDKEAIVNFYKSEVNKIIEKLKKIEDVSAFFLLGIEYEYYLNECYFYGENEDQDIIFEYASLKVHEKIHHFRTLTETDTIAELNDFVEEDYYLQIEKLFFQFNNLCLHEVFSDKTFSEQLNSIFKGKSINIIAGMHDLDDPNVIFQIN